MNPNNHRNENLSHTDESLRKHLQPLHAVKLTPEEHDAMKSRLLSYADLYTVTPQGIRKSVPSPFSFFSMQTSSRLIYSGALVVLLLIGSTGVTFAAQNTLPGQPLYAVKVEVAEPIETAIVTSTGGTVANASWQNTLAERRLNEAATLASQNQLATTTQVYLAQQVAIHVNQSEEDSDSLSQNGNTQAALAVRSDLQARLGAHAAILAIVASHLQAQGDGTTTAEVATLLHGVTSEENSVAMATLSTEAPTTYGAHARMGIAEAMSAQMASTSTDAATTDFVSNDDSDASGTPMLALAPSANDQGIRVEEARIFSQGLRALHLSPLLASTSSSTASTTISVTATSTTATSTEDASSTVNVLELPKI